MLVVDASVAVLWFVPQEHAEAASAILATRVRLVAPRLLRLEAASPLLRAVRRGEMPAAQARHILEVLIPASVTFADEPSDEIEAFEMAQSHGGSAYGALYVALARRLGAALVTNDRAVHRTAQATGVEARFLGDGPPP
jgi:predicted nucleic acid-binding protein